MRKQPQRPQGRREGGCHRNPDPKSSPPPGGPPGAQFHLAEAQRGQELVSFLQTPPPQKPDTPRMRRTGQGGSRPRTVLPEAGRGLRLTCVPGWKRGHETLHCPPRSLTWHLSGPGAAGSSRPCPRGNAILPARPHLQQILQYRLSGRPHSTRKPRSERAMTSSRSQSEWQGTRPWTTDGLDESAQCHLL